MKVRTNSSRCAINAFRNSSGLPNLVPSGSTPDASMGACPSVVRHFPIASKFSSAKPNGSIRWWQVAQTAFWRCACMSSRIDTSGCSRALVSGSGGTLGGGGGGGAPRMLSSRYLPRSTGEVRVAYDVTVRILPWPSNPARRGSVCTRRKCGP